MGIQADGQSVRRARAAAARVALVLALLVGAAGCVDDRWSEAKGLDDGGAEPLTPGAAFELPIADAASRYLVAHVLPDGYALLDVIAAPAPTAGYGLAGNGRLDTELWVRTMEGGLPVDLWDLAHAQIDTDPSYREVTVRGRRAVRYPLNDGGEDHGTALLWEERPGLWAQVEAAEPLTEAEAFAVAEGLQPFPEDRWDDLASGVDQNWYLDPGLADAAQRIPVIGSEDVSGWEVHAVVPPRWRELPTDRRWPCIQFTVAGALMAQPACGRPGRYVVGGNVYIVGMAPPEVQQVTVRAGETSVETGGGFWVDLTPDFQYWVAEMGPIGCSEYQAELAPPGLPSQLRLQMTAPSGPIEGCGAPGPNGEPPQPGTPPPDSATIPAG